MEGSSLVFRFFFGFFFFRFLFFAVKGKAVLTISLSLTEQMCRGLCLYVVLCWGEGIFILVISVAWLGGRGPKERKRKAERQKKYIYIYI